MEYPPSVPYDVFGEIMKDLVEDETTEAIVIDDALEAISEGDKEGAMALLECVAKARALRKSKAARALRRPRRRAASKKLVEA
jgi:hypothetical protein